MEPAFIYFEELTFNSEKKKKITLIFSQAKETKKVLFKKHKYYFITSFTCFLKLDITKNKNYKKIHEPSEICRNILSSSFDAGFTLDKVIFITDKSRFFDEEWKLKIDKNRKKFHTDNFKFYDSTEKKNRNVEVYNPYKQLQNEGFDFCDFNSNDVPEYYTVRLNDTDKLISKKLKCQKKRNI